MANKFGEKRRVERKILSYPVVGKCLKGVGALGGVSCLTADGGVVRGKSD